MYDLHTHSDASDGHLSPRELLARAEARGVAVLALTDHDTVKGCSELLAELRAQRIVSEIQLVTGVELTVVGASRTIHVLGLWVDVESLSLKALLDAQAAVREQRAIAIDLKLQKVGVCGALEGARQFAAGGVLSRPHFARYLVESGYCAREQQAYKRWLGRGKVADVPCQWVAMNDAIEIIHDSGGIAVLAHPDKYGVTRSGLRNIVAAFAEADGDALELVSGEQKTATTQYLSRLAAQFSLAASIGSDFHRPDEPWRDLGCAGDLPDGVQPVWRLPQISAARVEP